MIPMKELGLYTAIPALVSIARDYRSLDVFGNGCPCFRATYCTHLLNSTERGRYERLGTTRKLTPNICDVNAEELRGRAYKTKISSYG